MKKILLLALFPVMVYAADTPQSVADVNGVISCVKDNVMNCVNKCAPTAAAGGKDSETDKCVDKCKAGVEDKCKAEQLKKSQ